VKKNRYLHFRHPKVQVKKKNLSHFWLSVAAISQQLPGVQLPSCFWRIKQQKTSPETSQFLCRFSLIFTSFPNLTQLKSGPSPKWAHQATREEWQISAESLCSPGSRQPASAPSAVAGPLLHHPPPVPPRLCLRLPGAGLIFPWKRLARIPLPGKSLCSHLRRLSQTPLLRTLRRWHLPAAFSSQAGKPTSLSLPLYTPPLRWCWVDTGLARLSLVCQ